MKTVCGIDLGTQSCKLVIYDPEKKKVLASTQAELELTARNDGTREQETGWYEAAVANCFAGLSAEHRASITAIGISGQQHGFVPLDANGKAIYPVKLWCDTATSAECAELTQKAGGEAALLAETGLLMLPGYTAPKILWLKKHQPEAYARLRHVLLPHDYLNYLLTGKYVAEFGDASGTALFDVRKRQWSDKICGLIDPGLRSCLPDLVPPDGLAGIVSPAAAARYSIPAGIPVSAGGGDNMMGAIGTGAVQDGFLTMSLGTSGTLYGYSDSPVVDPAGNLAAFCSSTGGWLPLLCTMNCTVASEQLRELLGLDLAAFNAAAEAAPIGSEGVVVLPFFNGERIPNLPNGRASLNGLTAANFKAQNIARAAMEAAIFGMRIGLDSFKALGYQAKEIRLIGGGAKSPLWRTIAANVTGLPVKVPAGDDAAAMGAAIQALWAAGKTAGQPGTIGKLCAEHVALEGGSTINPDPKAVAAYEKAYTEYNKYLQALGPLYK
jgi:xylulokinase